MDVPAPDSVTPWWGTYTLEEEEGGQWDIGPSTVWLYRAARDWRVIHRPSTAASRTDPMVHRSNVMVPAPAEAIADLLDADDPDQQTNRYSFHKTKAQVTLTPALADRPVVSRPEHPLSVPPGESVTLYLSTAIWVRVVLPDRDDWLHEMPSHRMSDTWFGASTLDGTLCYATRTAGRLQLDKLPLRLHRAVTPLHVRNRASEALALERVQLPVPHLALYRAPSDTLWTNAVSMRHTAAGAGATVTIDEGPPSSVPEADRVQPPREPDRKGLFTSTFSAFGALFGP
jgi:hypothetical protein